jgi:hypothetical protein
VSPFPYIHRNKATITTLAISITTTVFSMSLDFNLNCWIFGEDLHDIITVSISKNANINTLKNAIWDMNKRDFDGFSARSLHLWKASISIDAELDPHSLNLVNDDSLHPLRMLSKVFTDPPLEEHLHIIVRPPPTGES